MDALNGLILSEWNNELLKLGVSGINFKFIYRILSPWEHKLFIYWDTIDLSSRDNKLFWALDFVSLSIKKQEWSKHFFLYLVHFKWYRGIQIMARLLDFVQLILDHFILSVQNLNDNIKVIVHMALVNEIRASTHVLK